MSPAGEKACSGVLCHPVTLPGPSSRPSPPAAREGPHGASVGFSQCRVIRRNPYSLLRCLFHCPVFSPTQLSPDLHYPSVASPGAKEGLVRVKITADFHSSQFPPVCSATVLAVLQGPGPAASPSLLQTTRVNIHTRMTETQQLPGRVPLTPTGCKCLKPTWQGEGLQGVK